MPDQPSNVNGRLRVLVVEDEWLVADYIVDVLEEAGHEVAATAATGEKAIEHLEQDAIDVALLDIKLKGSLSGIDVAQAARARGIPHVFITGSGDPTTRASAEATGPLGFLQKPFSPEGLMAILAGPTRQEKAHGN
ncbi:response regulator [Microvirga rosea]|uniref:response regulator n=1 Tax=Microvirga rosea TaxID=2715425 RepID=UPI001D0A5026|nr:response regulator [Microvirga rosea]MCB8822877.1 response regulator [Microvirga rosea]